MTSIACVVIASEKRRQLLDEQVMPSVVSQGFDEVVVVGDYRSGEGWRHIPFAPVWGDTRDAQLKRDVGAVATWSDWLFYLCDDHRPAPDFAAQWWAAPYRFGVLVPSRFCVRDGESVPLNTGLPDYCGGHAGVFPRAAIACVPWSAAPRHPNWDVIHTRMVMNRGFELHALPECRVEDVEGGTPWL